MKKHAGRNISATTYIKYHQINRYVHVQQFGHLIWTKKRRCLGDLGRLLKGFKGFFETLPERHKYGQSI